MNARTLLLLLALLPAQAFAQAVLPPEDDESMTYEDAPEPDEPAAMIGTYVDTPQPGDIAPPADLPPLAAAPQPERIPAPLPPPDEPPASIVDNSLDPLIPRDLTPLGPIPTDAEPPPEADAVAGAVLVPQELNGVTYVTGGVGVEEVQALKEQENKFNLKIVSSLKGGDFVSGTVASIYDTYGGLVFETNMAGPYLLVLLPPGKYSVEASQADTKQQQAITLPKTGIRQVTFGW